MAGVIFTHLVLDQFGSESLFLSFRFFFDFLSDMSEFPALLLPEFSFKLLFVESASLVVAELPVVLVPCVLLLPCVAALLLNGLPFCCPVGLMALFVVLLFCVPEAAVSCVVLLFCVAGVVLPWLVGRCPVGLMLLLVVL